MAAVTLPRQPTVAGTAFAMRDPWPWPTFEGLVREGEALGYRAVFLPEIAGRDAFAAFAALAGVTTTLLLGTGVVPMTARRAELTAMAAATVHERSGGRAILGIGTGAPKPGALEELDSRVGTMRSLLDPDRAARGASTLPLERPVPIWIAALGPRAVDAAGRIADGVLLNWCTPERVARAKAQLGESAERAGRDPSAITVAAYVRAAVGDEAEDALARRALAVAAGEYASFPAYRRQFEAMGVGTAAEVAAAAHASGSQASLDAVGPLLEAVCLTGASARAGLQAFREAGCDLPVVYPVAYGRDGARSVAATLRALAPTA
jgi:alkanesulfonate monooxygenase SsuD/methylene tetrahydromethanopterin reductase-like flavin-dependent oxidoreductase (luciferase family)